MVEQMLTSMVMAFCMVVVMIAMIPKEIGRASCRL
ncbi:hypothetical protein SKERS_245 [Escherichia phage vB_EcoM_Skers]|nr:hypothetical protein SKERS_245 [Escherichia phage vB_EcoM_Skers]